MQHPSNDQIHSLNGYCIEVGSSEVAKIALQADFAPELIIQNLAAVEFD